MQDYSGISQIKAVSSYEEVNTLLRDYWKLLDIFHDSDGLPVFVLGDQLDSVGRVIMQDIKEEMTVGIS